MQMGQEPRELQQGCAVYPPGLPCQQRGDKNRFNLQNHPLDTKSKQLVRSRVKDVKGAERDSLCCSASSIWLCFISQRGLQHLCCRAGNTGASYEGAQGKVSQLVSGKRLGTHWKSQHKVHQELSFAITRLHHRQEAVPKAWKCLQLRVSFLLPQKVLCSGERGTGFPLQSFALASCGCPHAACSSPVLCFPRHLLIDLSSVSCHCKIQRLCSESSARVKV